MKQNNWLGFGEEKIILDLVDSVKDYFYRQFTYILDCLDNLNLF